MNLRIGLMMTGRICKYDQASVIPATRWDLLVDLITREEPSKQVYVLSGN
jgi:hypothetical protein